MRSTHFEASVYPWPRSNGMGLASARRLAEDGCNLALSDLNRDAGKAAIDTLSQDFPSQKFLVRLQSMFHKPC